MGYRVGDQRMDKDMVMSRGDNLTTSHTLLRALLGPGRDEASWRTFVSRYGPLIHGWCRHAGLGHQAAEEMQADVLAKLSCSLEGYNPARRFRGWLKAVTMNAVRDLWRGRARRPWDRPSGGTDAQVLLGQVTDAADGSPPGSDAAAVRQEEALRIAEEIQGRVEPRTWRAFWLTAIEGETAAAVGRELGMTSDGVYMATHRVRKMLREKGLKADLGHCAREGERP